MRWVSSLVTGLLTVSIFCVLAYAGTPGSFRGTVVEGEQGSPREGWLYIRGRNGAIRSVDISQAIVGYDEAVPSDQRKSPARGQLVVGAEVRVTAEQGSDGEWRASRVEIVKPAPAQSAAVLVSVSSHRLMIADGTLHSIAADRVQLVQLNSAKPGARVVGGKVAIL